MPSPDPSRHRAGYAMRQLFDSAQGVLISLDEFHSVSQQCRHLFYPGMWGRRLPLLRSITTLKCGALLTQLNDVSDAIPELMRPDVVDVRVALQDLLECLSFTRSWAPSKWYPFAIDFDELEKPSEQKDVKASGLNVSADQVRLARREIWVEHASKCERAHAELRRFVHGLRDVMDTSEADLALNSSPEGSDTRLPETRLRESIVLDLLQSRSPNAVAGKDAENALKSRNASASESQTFKILQRLVAMGKAHKRGLRGFYFGPPDRNENARPH